jgi:hypothetical protein
LKKYHSLKLASGGNGNGNGNGNGDDKKEDIVKNNIKDEDVFVLGNVVCAFLNFCHQTLDNKAAYQQIVLLMVCLLDHIKSIKPYNNPQFSILTQCRK